MGGFQCFEQIKQRLTIICFVMVYASKYDVNPLQRLMFNSIVSGQRLLKYQNRFMTFII